MKLFLSWSGERSRGIAQVLRRTLPLLMNAAKPWMSDADIEKGERWNAALSGELDSAKVGIFCLTPANLNRPALLFEAGAISKSLTDARVCVLLDGMEPANVGWPWAQFQCTRLHQQDDMQKMLADINKWIMDAGEPPVPPEQFPAAVKMWWPELQRELKGVPADALAHAPERSEKEMLAEILEILRTQQRTAAEAHPEGTTLLTSAKLANPRLLEQLGIRPTPPQPTLGQIETSYLNGERLKRLFTEALDREGLDTAAAYLASSDIVVDDSGVCTVTVPMRQAVLALTFNPDAVAIMRKAAKAGGFGIKDLRMVPAETK